VRCGSVPGWLAASQEIGALVARQTSALAGSNSLCGTMCEIAHTGPCGGGQGSWQRAQWLRQHTEWTAGWAEAGLHPACDMHHVRVVLAGGARWRAALVLVTQQAEVVRWW
jgi:hypothetical protein